uniref:Uncharacterized protein n=1 Tax=viral metagenome TaxID=1070528 RepID=A0A6M3KPJ8_9ZZZZ
MERYEVHGDNVDEKYRMALSDLVKDSIKIAALEQANTIANNTINLMAKHIAALEGGTDARNKE